jgi:ubiquitin-protein ligase
MKAALKRIMNVDMKRIQNNNLNENGIYIEFDEKDMFKAKALIVGPNDTIYECGFLFFEITFPSNYPFSPPEIKYIAQNKIRIHPNIYVNGKVCLSILGTWSGPGWTTIMDITNVLFTIQSLLDNDPLCNEPGYEKKNKMKLDLYDNYNMAIKYNTIDSLIINRIKYNLGDFEIFRKNISEHISKYNSKILENIEKEKNIKMNINLNVYYINLNIDYEKLMKKWIKYIKFE